MPTTKYLCDLCGSDWGNDLEGAKECETTHIGVEKAVRIVPTFEPEDIFPGKLKITWHYKTQDVTVYYTATEEEWPDEIEDKPYVDRETAWCPKEENHESE
jgi:hypothetical protein